MNTLELARIRLAKLNDDLDEAMNSYRGERELHGLAYDIEAAEAEVTKLEKEAVGK